MSVLIKNLHIKNFKSVRDLSLECDRINIFIGKPNAGKSNILEAISLLGAGYSESKNFMSEFIRYSKIPQLFYNFNFNSSIEIKSDEIIATFQLQRQTNSFNFVTTPNVKSDSEKKGARLVDLNRPIPFFEVEDISNDGAYRSARYRDLPDNVKKYVFNSLGEYEEKGLFLHPPHGENFYLIVRSHKGLREEIQQFLKPNGLKLLLDEETKSISIVQETEDSLIRFPLHLVPDTFQRYIFHLAAIMSNRDSVLLFEEPESHSYAPYVYQLAQHILDDEGGNQYFITTHSPYFLLPLMQEGKDVAVFATWFEDYQTHARRLSEEEIRELLDYGVDVFLNLDHFTPA